MQQKIETQTFSKSARPMQIYQLSFGSEYDASFTKELEEKS